MIDLINQIDSSTDETDKIQLASNLIQKVDEYGMLNAVLNVEPLAERILNIPGTPVGVTNKQSDVSKLKQLSADMKTKLKMKQFDPTKILLDEAYAIIEKYKESL
jgi:DNA-binding ferritin-like protein